MTVLPAKGEGCFSAQELSPVSFHCYEGRSTPQDPHAAETRLGRPLGQPLQVFRQRDTVKPPWRVLLRMSTADKFELAVEVSCRYQNISPPGSQCR